MTEEEIEYHTNILRLAKEAEDGNVIEIPKGLRTEEEFFKWLETAEVKNT